MVRMRSLISLNCCQTESCVSNLVGMGFMSDWSVIETNLGYYYTCVSVCTMSMYGVQSLWEGMRVMSLCHSECLCKSMYYLRVMDDAVSYAVLMSYTGLGSVHAVLGCPTQRLLRERASTVHSEVPYRTMYSPD